MKVGTTLRAISRRAPVHACWALCFAFSWWIHCLAFVKMERCNRQFFSMDDRTLRTMALLDLVTTNYWAAIAYAFLAVAAVAFLQLRGRPPWTHWLAALIFCMPCIVYWTACGYILGKLL